MTACEAPGAQRGSPARRALALFVLAAAAAYLSTAVAAEAAGGASATPLLSAELVGKVMGVKAAVTSEGAVKVNWTRDDVPVEVDGARLPPAAGLGSWAAFKAHRHRVVVMGDTVVFQDEADAAMDAAFANGLEVTALHNHFFYDEPRVLFMHIGGHGDAETLARGVRAVWDAIKRVRAAAPVPAKGFGPVRKAGAIDAKTVESATGFKAETPAPGVLKISAGRDTFMHGVRIGETMGVNTWAAFAGSDEAATMDGDFVMSVLEVQPVLKALRAHGLHIVALHNHMIGERPIVFFTHFWGTGSVRDLAAAFKAALDAQRAAAATDSEQ